MASGKVGPAGSFQNMVSGGPDFDSTHFLGLRNDGSVVGWGESILSGPSAGEVASIIDYGGLSIYEGIGTHSYIQKDCDARFNYIYGYMQVTGFGANEYAQFGTDSTSPTVIIGWGFNMSFIFAGVFGHHVIGIDATGYLHCWGRNDYNQCSSLTDNPLFKYEDAIEVGPFLTAGAGRDFSIAIKQDGTLWARGRNDAGQCGILGTSPIMEWEQVGTETKWVEIACGADHTLLLTKYGQLYGMGGNSQGQLGVGHNNDVLEPERLNGYIFATVAAGYNFSVGYTKDGEWYGWGSNSHGQLSLSGAIGGTYNTPQLGSIDISQDTTATSVKQISCGAYHTACITNAVISITDKSYIYACGDNTYGQVANGVVGGPPVSTIRRCVSAPVLSPGEILEVSEHTSSDYWQLVECGSYHMQVSGYAYGTSSYCIGRNDTMQCTPQYTSDDTAGIWLNHGVGGVWSSSGTCGDNFSMKLVNE